MAKRSGLRRRTLLAAVGFAPLASCSPARTPSAPAATTSTAEAASPSATPPASFVAEDAGLAALEQQYGARLGVFAVATGTGAVVVHRPEERFALCSTYKVLAAAGLLSRGEGLERVVRYTTAELMSSSVVTRAHVTTGMTLRALVDAALRFSDGTAGNLLVRELGGPEALTEYARTLGDAVTRLDRPEPALAEAVPGDVRDTTSPRALAGDYRRILLGDALDDSGRSLLLDLLRHNTTGDARIRAPTIEQSWCDVLGMDRSAAAGRGWADFVDPTGSAAARPFVASRSATSGSSSGCDASTGRSAPWM